ncbi:MAG: hypothetical protein ACKOEW_06780 [Methylocystis sp.]
MANVLMSATQSGPTYLSRSRALARIAFIDVVFHQLTRLSAITVLVILGGVIVSLIHGAQPAIKAFGFGFLAVQSWNPVTENFGAGPGVYDTLVTSLVAMLIAVPIGLAIELLADIPSIIYGIWGLFVFAPFMETYTQPELIAAPLLFTALNNQFWSSDLNAPMASLPVVIFQFALSPYKDWQQLAWTGALLITVTVLTLSIIARAFSAGRRN